MANVFDYLHWRGDLKIINGEITDIDGMILSRLSYLPFDGFAGEGFDDKLPLKAVAEKVLKSDENLKKILWKGDTELLQITAESERFGNLLISGYRNIIDDERQVQYSSITFELDEKHHFISFRGTDNTLTGWQEDFNLFCTFPLLSQTLALRYFESAAEHFGGSFILGGHSKGGNLAIYSASFCSKENQDKITSIYNLDGPGFDSSAIAESGFKNVKDKINTYVPQSSIFGMMFEHEESYTVIKSNQKGFFQHDIYSWEINPTTLVTLNRINGMSVFFDHTLTEFVQKMSLDERKAFTEALFNVLKTTDDKTFNEILANWFKDTGRILRTMKNLDPETRSLISSAIFSFIKCAVNNFSDLNPIVKLKSKTKSAQG